MKLSVLEWTNLRLRVVKRLKEIQSSRIDKLTTTRKCSIENLNYFRGWLITLLMVQWLPIREPGLITNSFVSVEEPFIKAHGDTGFISYETKIKKSNNVFFKIHRQWYCIFLFDKVWASEIGGSIPLTPACNYYFDHYVNMTQPYYRKHSDRMVFYLKGLDKLDKPMSLVTGWWKDNLRNMYNSSTKNFFRKMFTAVVWSVAGTDRAVLEEWSRFSRHSVDTQKDEYVQQDYHPAIPWDEEKNGKFLFITPPGIVPEKTVDWDEFYRKVRYTKLGGVLFGTQPERVATTGRFNGVMEYRGNRATDTLPLNSVFVGIDTSPVCTAVCFCHIDDRKSTTYTWKVFIKNPVEAEKLSMDSVSTAWLKKSLDKTSFTIAGNTGFVLAYNRNAIGKDVVDQINKFVIINSVKHVFVSLEKHIRFRPAFTLKAQIEWTKEVHEKVSAWCMCNKHPLVYSDPDVIRAVCKFHGLETPASLILQTEIQVVDEDVYEVQLPKAKHPVKDIADALRACVYAQSLYAVTGGWAAD
jgi:hypothetical protein